MNSIQDYEIMAPAGSYESLTAAIQGGADSIYFGIEGLNMRAKSSNNFTIADLHNIARICRENNLKSYLTVNTIIYNNDMTLMRKIVDAAREANLSAIIAADVAVLMYARSIGVEVHLSTQLNITNTESLKFYAQFADVVVLARELTLEQVASIHRDIVEQQIIGLGRADSNRDVCTRCLVHGRIRKMLPEPARKKIFPPTGGACNQICRRGYIVKDKDSEIELEIDNEYIMSPKDLKTIHFMNKMMDAGVQVFKIEGRARGGPEYVRIVTSCYKEAVQAYCSDIYTEEKISDWNERLSTVFNRGFWNGYYLGQRLGEWTHRYGSGATKRKVYVGKAIKHFGNLGVTEFLVETQSVRQGDELLITGPTTGAVFVTADDIRVDLATVPEAFKGDHFSIKVNEKIRPNDQLYKMVAANRKGTSHER